MQYHDMTHTIREKTKLLARVRRIRGTTASDWALTPGLTVARARAEPDPSRYKRRCSDLGELQPALADRRDAHCVQSDRRAQPRRERQYGADDKRAITMSHSTDPSCCSGS
jgi:hypothetical protein